MMQNAVTRLYPVPGTQYPIEGLYLQHRLHRKGLPDSPYVYSDFITTLDGRIALGSNDSTMHTVPDATVNPRDWRLYQELAGQADLLITSGRYFRQSHIGEAQDQLPVATMAPGPGLTRTAGYRHSQWQPGYPAGGTATLPEPSHSGHHRRDIGFETGDCIAAGWNRGRSSRSRNRG
jgi:hypothetical protein